MRNRLDWDAESTREFLRAASDVVADYYERLNDLPIMPGASAGPLRTQIDQAQLRDPAELAELLEFFKQVIIPTSRHNGHSRFFGYVASPGSGISTAGEMLAAALNANVTSWRSAPAATELEKSVVDQLKQMLGLSAECLGILVSGGSIANFAGLAAARSAAHPEISRDGSVGKRLRVYVSEEGHFSIEKAVGMLGIGQANLQKIQTDSRFRIQVQALEERIEQDVAAGYTPMCIVANAGTVATGAVDPIAEIAAVAARRDIWLHVDGAYGGFAAITPSGRPLLESLHRADSISLDPHKWLYTSMGCGCIVYRDAEAARCAFAHDADYTRLVGLAGDEAFAFWDYGPELSRPFRALPVWMQLKYAGIDGIADSIEHNIQCAKYFERIIQSAKDFEMTAPVELSIFCFRCAPRRFQGDLNSLNERVLVELQRGGSSYLSNATVRGRFSLRGCVLNYRTTETDMEILLKDVRDALGRVMR